METQQLVLDPPRWPGGPPVCPVANLPAFATEEAGAKFCTSAMTSVVKKWKCTACGNWHVWTTEAGDTNGQTRAGADVQSSLARLMASPLAGTIPKEAM